MTESKYYITTPIYYVNFKPHIGTSYTTILSDVVSRYRRLRAQKVLMVTGSDEHSQNIADLAEQAGKTPQAYCDEMIPKFQSCWDLVNIQQYRFERTSDPAHHRLVQKFWQAIYERGDVYKGTYSGWYHTSDNRYLDPEEVPENPETHPRLKYLTEESYYFKLSRYQEWLLQFHEANPNFVIPDFRRNEMLSRIRQGLNDICISRTSTSWGIPIPWDKGHVFYVWIEALLTYLTASGFDIDAFNALRRNGVPCEVKDPLWTTTREDLKSQPPTNFWPADLHVMAKDIPWFHAVIWPAMLASCGVPPPKQLLVHGYWQFGGEKMSKSLGNVVDPYDAVKVVGVDGLRYFLMREVPPGRDGNFNYEALVNRYNFDLANDLGNLVHRTTSLIHQLFDGKVPPLIKTYANDDLETARRALIGTVCDAYDRLAFSDALQAIWLVVKQGNQYVNDKKLWELKQKPDRHDEVGSAFFHLINVIRTVVVLAYPVIPTAANRFWKILNLTGTLEALREHDLYEVIPEGHRLNASEIVFQRIDLKQIEPHLPKGEPHVTSSTNENSETSTEGVITIDDFARVELRIAQVKQAERVEKADRLLKLEVDDGERTRQIIAGIAKWYAPEELIGKRIVIVANLKPAKLRGLLSEGMLLASEDKEGRLSVIAPERDVSVGSRVR